MGANAIVVCVFFLFGLDIDFALGEQVDTLNGIVEGTRETVLGKKVDVFYGIPFAKPPVGDLRFKHPEPVDSWRPDVKDATKKPPSCVQSFAWFDLIGAPPRHRPSSEMSEDCLYLNIWSPVKEDENDDTLMSVMVWIHGGSFSFGSSNAENYNGQYLAVENDVIVVTVNYRLGPLGFSYLGPDTIPGNMGFMDQIEALKWIQNNIILFGGDKETVTLFGESAGAFSVGFHIVSPLSEDLFHNAILQSGSPIHSIHSTYVQTKMEGSELLHKLASELNCSLESAELTFDCLKEADAQRMVTIARNRMMYFSSVVDGHFMPDMPYALVKSNNFKHTNVLHGVTENESTIFLLMFLNPKRMVLYSTGKEITLADLPTALVMTIGQYQSQQQMKALQDFYISEQEPPVDLVMMLDHLGSDYSLKCPHLLMSEEFSKSVEVFLYSFNHRASNTIAPPWMGVPHGSEIDFVFGAPLNRSLGFSWQDRALSREIMTYWTNFVKSGNPDSPVKPKEPWPRFESMNQTHMALAVDPAPQQGFRRHQCAFVNDILPHVRDINDFETTASGSVGVRSSCIQILALLTTILSCFWR